MHLSEVTKEMDEFLDRLKTGIFGAEPLSESVRKNLEKRLGITAFDSSELSELFGPGVAFECKRRDGFHIWHDSYLVEISDLISRERVSD